MTTIENREIPIKITMARESVPFIEPYRAYCALRRRYGDEGVYLLESLAGPEVDTRSAMVGFNALASIFIYGTTVTVEGRGNLRDRILSVLRRVPGVSVTQNKAEIPEDHTIWIMLRAIQAEFDCTANSQKDGYNFGFFGFLGYDTVRFVERLPLIIPRREEAVDSCLVIFQGAVRFDLVRQTVQVRIANAPEWPTIEPSAIAKVLGDAPPVEGSGPNATAAKRVSGSTTKERYLEDAKTALDYIGIGDIYQVQLGQELTIETDLSPEDVYLRLRGRNPAPYMYLAKFGPVTLVGASPEVFVRLERDEIVMRPLAGTVRPGKTDAATARASKKLRNDPKEVAEHVMLVDLCRNDIGRVCTPGSLTVTSLLATERYSHVIHLVSNVVGQLHAGKDIYDLIAASFPAGTMTGAPKIRAMEIIEELEMTRRGIYAGAIGLIDFSGDANLALCIRTAFHENGKFHIRASAGIVADSRPEAEWNETLAKLGATYWAITGEEIAQ